MIQIEPAPSSTEMTESDSNGSASGVVTQPSAELSVILSAWNTATERLQKTHDTLCNEVRRLTDELEIKNRELARKNRLADLGQMASHVAHEVRNGLAPVTLYLSLLRRRVAADSEGVRLVDRLERGFASLETTVNDMLSFASDRVAQARRFNLAQLVLEIDESLAPQLQSQQVQCHVDVPSTLYLWADRDMIRRAIVNLILNAVDVLPRGGGIHVTAWEDEWSSNIEVADGGPGITADVVTRIFEPFFTTKSEGSGLGLAIVQRTAEAHGGMVTVQNCPEGGAAFTLHLPKHNEEATS